MESILTSCGDDRVLLLRSGPELRNVGVFFHGTSSDGHIVSVTAVTRREFRSHLRCISLADSVLFVNQPRSHSPEAMITPNVRRISVEEYCS
jgi:hypothetical protein